MRRRYMGNPCGLVPWPTKNGVIGNLQTSTMPNATRGTLMVIRERKSFLVHVRRRINAL